MRELSPRHVKHVAQNANEEGDYNRTRPKRPEPTYQDCASVRTKCANSHPAVEGELDLATREDRWVALVRFYGPAEARYGAVVRAGAD
jgi:hypothetical protein